MEKNTRTTNLLDKLIIIADFLVLNIFFALYLRYDWKVLHFSTGIDSKYLYLSVNGAMVIAQYFYSNVVYKRKIQIDAVIRRATFLTFTFVLAAFCITKILLSIYGLKSPSGFFYPYFAPVLYLVILSSRFVERYLIGYIRMMGRNHRTALFIGSDNALLSVSNQLANDLTMGYNIIGYYADKEIAYEHADKDMPRKGSLADLVELMEKGEPLGVDEIYCSLCDDREDLIRAIMNYCDKNVIHFYYVPPFTHTFGFNLSMERIGTSVVFTNHETPLTLMSNRIIKRTFDVIFSLIICLGLLVLIPIIAVIIKIQSPGPIFFRQKRTGLGGKDFVCYKFRSMHVNVDADKLQATEHDPRKFAFGNFMRKSNIDELPQFYCVLKGDMSIVGPRPHMLYHTEMYSALIDKYMVRHFAKPGITGWAQVTGFRGETKELWQMEGRVRKDIWYIENWTFWLDLAIIFKTAKQIIIHDKQAY
ncbi:MAG: exopolysaccharide biosynthesis polyprenyl glycosylphosphotransferase [Prevotella sp.]|nr:exopolysaccharide biosynthesis polyprenyl glycosylphosphotransferase [Prevotella sp.]